MEDPAVADAELEQRQLRGLALPRVDTRVHFNEAQRRLFDRVFG